MKKIRKYGVIFFIFCLISEFLIPNQSLAEYKSDIPSGQNISKIETSPDSPKLLNGHVYPNWGPVCQRYTYSVIYQDDKGRPPEYMKIYFNGQMYDMDKENPDNNDYFKGVKYVYKYVPKKLGSNFYFFEASNGLGKARSNIIDSPDNGPVLFKSSFENNEVAVIDVAGKTKILSYDLKDEWVGGIAISDNGKYLAVKTHKKVYLFDTSKPDEPIWVYEGPGESPGDVKGGIDISGDGSRIFASIGGRGILFNNKSNQPLWVYQGTNNAYNAAISKDGKYMAIGTAGGVTSTTEGYKSDPNTNLLILWNEKNEIPLWQYHTEGNFHDVSLSDDGSFVAGATGCPDRRFYLFSKDSNQPLIKSEMLTRDSPVHRAKISGDGQYVAVGSESGDGAVFLFSKSSDIPVWKYPMPGNSSARALNFTSDGIHIGAATFAGDVFIFNKTSSNPVSHWSVDASLGGIDIAEDGSFVAAGGTDNKVHVFHKDSSDSFSIDFKEYVEEIDISADGKLIAAGTGGSVYFFEAFDENTQPVECAEVKEPPVENYSNNPADDRKNNYPIDDKANGSTRIKLFFVWPLGLLITLGTLGIYYLTIRFSLLSKLRLKSKEELLEKTLKEKGLKPAKLNKIVIFILGIISLIFLILTTISLIQPHEGNTQKAVNNSNQLKEQNDQTQKTGCGNSMCEPDLGETNVNCPTDCMSEAKQ